MFTRSAQFGVCRHWRASWWHGKADERVGVVEQSLVDKEKDNTVKGFV